MSTAPPQFIGTWQDDHVFAKLKNNRNVHNPERMMTGWGANDGFEAQVGQKNLIDAGLLELLSTYRRAVCKITCTGKNYMGITEDWTGTGFLVGPNLLVTNNHVLNSEVVAAAATVDFEFERSPNDLLQRKTVSRNVRQGLSLDPSRLFYTHPAIGGLDFTFVWVSDNTAHDYGFIPMSRGSFSGRVYDPVFLIHHPDGDFKKVSVDDTELLNVDLDLLLYAADTEGGSSGCPVITRSGKLCGLHHAYSSDGNLLAKHSTRAKTLQDGQTYRVANEGIQFSAIAVHLENELSRDSLHKTAVLEILRHFNDTDTVTGPYGVLGRRLEKQSSLERDNRVRDSTQIIEAYNATQQDLDVSVWNMGWLNRHRTDSSTLRRAATVFADMTQDVWVLNGISRETAEALRRELKGVYEQDFQFVFSEAEAHPAQPVTALFLNTQSVRVTQVPWPAPVRALWNAKAHADLKLETLSGAIFPNFPARFEVEVLGSALQYKITLVPLFVGEHGDLTLRKAVAARIMTEVIGLMVHERDIGTDWLIAGDVNAPLQRTRIEAFEEIGILPILAQDPARGGFSYLRHPHSVLSQMFVPEGTEGIGQHGGMITTVPHVFANWSVKALTSQAPYGVRLSLMDEATVDDLKRTEVFLQQARPTTQVESVYESGVAEWEWRGLGKRDFMHRNAARLALVLNQTNDALGQDYGPTHIPLTIDDLFVLIYCEAGFTGGAMDPMAHHSLGERGLLPLPNNLAFWLGRPAPPHDAALPIAQNISLYADYLGHVKNRRVKPSAHGDLYRDLFEKPGIADAPERQAKLLAGIIHGYFLSANYRGGARPNQPHLLASYAQDAAIQTMLQGSRYVHDGTTILHNRQSNIDSALADLLTSLDLF
ncbi:MAG: serine protease [Paracoccaceae bacterium]